MNVDKEIIADMAKKLRSIRKSRGLSLEAVAQLSGVSKSMLSQIERAVSSPTIATLWNITHALQIDLADVLGQNPNKLAIEEIMRSERTPTIDVRGDGCNIRILSAPADSGKYEVYDIRFDENGALISNEPHPEGSKENLTVIEGNVVVEVGDMTASLAEGDTVRYAADCPHAIKATSKKARIILVVKSI